MNHDHDIRTVTLQGAEAGNSLVFASPAKGKNLPMWKVEVVESATDTVVKTLGPFPNESRAEKCMDGLDINLDHASFFTRVALA